MNLDKIDYELIKLLQKNARLSISEIANILDISRPTVRKRLRKLVKSGIIKNFTVIIDDSLIKGIHVIFGFRTDDVEKLVELLKDMDEFSEIYITSGEKNVIAKAIYLDVKSFRETIDKFVDLNISFDANLILKKIKGPHEYIPRLLFKLTCDYCGKEIERKPLTFILYNREFYFCCTTCLRDFRRMRAAEST